MVNRAWDFGMTKWCKISWGPMFRVKERTFDDVFDGDNLECFCRLQHNNSLKPDQRGVLAPFDYHDVSAPRLRPKTWSKRTLDNGPCEVRLYQPRGELFRR